MMEFLKFISQDGNHFSGFILVLIIVLVFAVEITQAIRKPKK
jgi:hypothetical protein